MRANSRAWASANTHAVGGRARSTRARARARARVVIVAVVVAFAVTLAARGISPTGFLLRALWAFCVSRCTPTRIGRLTRTLGQARREGERDRGGEERPHPAVLRARRPRAAFGRACLRHAPSAAPRPLHPARGRAQERCRLRRRSTASPRDLVQGAALNAPHPRR